MILIMFNGVMSGSQVPLDERTLDDMTQDGRKSRNTLLGNARSKNTGSKNTR